MPAWAGVDRVFGDGDLVGKQRIEGFAAVAQHQFQHGETPVR